MRLSSRLPFLFSSFHFTHSFCLKLVREFGCAAISDWLSFVVSSLLECDVCWIACGGGGHGAWDSEVDGGLGK